MRCVTLVGLGVLVGIVLGVLLTKAAERERPRTLVLSPVGEQGWRREGNWWHYEFRQPIEVRGADVIGVAFQAEDPAREEP